MTVVEAPGKLYIAGEYAVLRPGGAAVLIAVNRFVTVRAAAREPAVRTVTSDHTGNRPVQLGESDADLRFVAAAAEVVDQYVRETGGARFGFALEISSGLDDAATGRKYGLGSSGAVTAGVVKALATMLKLPLTEQEQLKLALLAVFDADPRGSGGDVATSFLAAECLGGAGDSADPASSWVSYRSPDRDQLARWRAADGVAATVGRAWPLFEAARLLAPRGLEVAVGWTGRPAISSELVGSLRTATTPEQFADFGTRSDVCVSRLVEALKAGDDGSAAAAVDAVGALLREIGTASGVAIETPQLTSLRLAAESLGVVAKTSGAGGGDCGIALVPPALRDDLDRRWHAAGVTVLDL